MKKKRILAMLLAMVLVVSSIAGTAMAADMLPMEMPAGGMPGGMPGGGGTASVTTSRCTEGPWSFVLSVSGSERTVTITGWDKSTADEIIIVPAILGGGRVTAIASTAFNASHAVKAVYLPSTVETIADFAFYDLNNLYYISCGNSDVVIEGQALASCNNQDIQTSGSAVAVNVVNPEAAEIAGGSYINGGTDYDISLWDVAAISQGDYQISSTAITFKGDAYVPESTDKDIKIHRSLRKEISEDDFRYTFRNLSDEKDAEAFAEEIAVGAFATVQLGMDYSPGYYLNGAKVQISEDCKAYDAATGEELVEIVSTGLAYTYVAYVTVHRVASKSNRSPDNTEKHRYPSTE